MKFILEVELDDDGGPNTAKELGRVLRYWGGSISQVELAPGATMPIYDSTYREIGRWSIERASTAS